MIADDHSMVREGLKQLLELEEDIKVIAQSGNGEETIKKIIEFNPDVVLLDINMPKFNGLEVLEYLKENNIKSKVLILTIHNEVEYLYKAVEIGVNGYVLKDSDADVLIKAIRAIHNGESYIQPNMAAQLFKKMNNSNIKNSIQSDKLTRREIEVLKLITQGLLNKEIAHNLAISEKTVKNHVSNIFKKIGVSDRTQAAVFAIKNNIVDIFLNT
jgi:DNA-binding NarL/FixJ family response regulator